MIQWQSTEILSVLTIIFPVVHKIINGFYHFALCWNYMMSQTAKVAAYVETKVTGELREELGRKY